MNPDRISELLLKALEHELGAMRIYRAAIDAALHDHLQVSWERDLERSASHVAWLKRVCEALDIDPGTQSEARQGARREIERLVSLLTAARSDPEAAQAVALESVEVVSRQSQANWDLLSAVAQLPPGSAARQLREASGSPAASC